MPKNPSVTPSSIDLKLSTMHAKLMEIGLSAGQVEVVHNTLKGFEVRLTQKGLKKLSPDMRTIINSRGFRILPMA